MQRIAWAENYPSHQAARPQIAWDQYFPSPRRKRSKLLRSETSHCLRWQCGELLRLETSHCLGRQCSELLWLKAFHCLRWQCSELPGQATHHIRRQGRKLLGINTSHHRGGSAANCSGAKPPIAFGGSAANCCGLNPPIASGGNAAMLRRNLPLPRAAMQRIAWAGSQPSPQVTTDRTVSGPFHPSPSGEVQPADLAGSLHCFRWQCSKLLLKPSHCLRWQCGNCSALKPPLPQAATQRIAWAGSQTSPQVTTDGTVSWPFLPSPFGKCCELIWLEASHCLRRQLSKLLRLKPPIASGGNAAIAPP